MSCAGLAGGLLLLASCGGEKKADPAAEAPPASTVETAPDASVVTVDKPEQFPLVAAVARQARSQLAVTGVVAPDISRTVPVISIATGRVVDIKARLGDTVKKGQLLMQVQSADIASAFSDYQKAVADETLSNTQLERAKLLYDKGAISQNDLQTAENAENKAKVDVQTSREHLRVLGAGTEHPSGVVDIYAPISGVITDQQVTNAGGIQGLAATANPFTISDLSSVWILCDVYENELPNVHVGETADIRLAAYPDKAFTGTISNIGAVLDPNIRTAKVRIEVKNPGLMKVGMFVTTTFHGQKEETHAVVPASAILHLHDRDWVYVAAGDKKFKRLEVKTGNTLANNTQEILSGLEPGQRVVTNALVLQNTVEQ
ncbi:MAG: efflux RND transporter periplasmic adaptor subunit [Candidatus Acidiferrum sp.]|jgi:cobalt-zinc-cadmium efflux system membrane fusion protein